MQGHVELLNLLSPGRPSAERQSEHYNCNGSEDVTYVRYPQLTYVSLCRSQLGSLQGLHGPILYKSGDRDWLPQSAVQSAHEVSCIQIRDTTETRDGCTTYRANDEVSGKFMLFIARSSLRSRSTIRRSALRSRSSFFRASRSPLRSRSIVFRLAPLRFPLRSRSAHMLWRPHGAGFPAAGRLRVNFMLLKVVKTDIT